MANQLNVFKSQLFEFTLSNQDVYQAPTGYTAIVLNAQCANVSANPATVTFQIYKNSANTTAELVKNLVIPGYDAANLATGKLVLESGDKLQGLCDTNSALKLTLSFLESLDA